MNFLENAQPTPTKKWLLAGSIDGDSIDFETIIESETEPDFWDCYELAAAHGCCFFTVEEVSQW